MSCDSTSHELRLRKRTSILGPINLRRSALEQFLSPVLMQYTGERRNFRRRAAGESRQPVPHPCTFVRAVSVDKLVLLLLRTVRDYRTIL